jgi:hypothetical protein
MAGYISHQYRLEIEGQDAGPLQSVEGGEPYGEVVEVARQGPGASVSKEIGAVHYSDIAIECSPLLPAPLMGWVSAMLGGSAPLHAGAIVELDQSTEVSRLEFSNAVIREVEFPSLNAAEQHKEVYLTIRLAPGSTQRHAGSHQSRSMTGVAKRVQSSDFRLRIDTLGSNVSTIGPLVVRQTTAALEIPDLVVTLPEDDHWYDWRDACLDLQAGTERTGILEYAPQSLQNVLARIDFSGLGIHSLVAERTGARRQGRRTVRASMYCESLRYTVLSQPVYQSTSTAKRTTTLGGKLRSRVDVIAPLTERLEAPAEPS